MTSNQRIGVYSAALGAIFIGCMIYTAANNRHQSYSAPTADISSLKYLMEIPEVGKVSVQGNNVYVGFKAMPTNDDLSTIVRGAALNYAAAIQDDVYGHATDVADMNSDWCTTHADGGVILQADGSHAWQGMIMHTGLGYC